MFKYFLIIFVACCNPVNAQDLGKRLTFSVGTTLLQNQYNSPRYKYDNNYAFKNPLQNIKSINVGISYRLFKDFPLYLGIKTNRLFNWEIKNHARDVYIKKEIETKQKLIADSLILGMAIHKNLMPFIIASHIDSTTKFVYNKNLTVVNKKASMTYGGGMAYIITSKHSLSILYLLPNKDLYTDYTVGLSYNYNI